jgi:CheY-like chemotaxis protein
MTAAHAQRVETGRRDVLVVDDDPNLRQLIRRALEEEGLSVAAAGDGRAAEKARRTGARAYLHKPFEVDGLVRALRRILAA